MPTPCWNIGSVLPILGLGFTILLYFLGRVPPEKPPHVFRLRFYSKTLFRVCTLNRDCAMKILFQVCIFRLKNWITCNLKNTYRYQTQSRTGALINTHLPHEPARSGELRRTGALAAWSFVAGPFALGCLCCCVPLFVCFSSPRPLAQVKPLLLHAPRLQVGSSVPSPSVCFARVATLPACQGKDDYPASWLQVLPR